MFSTSHKKQQPIKNVNRITIKEEIQSYQKRHGEASKTDNTWLKDKNPII